MSERSFLVANYPSDASVVATGAAGVRTFAEFVQDVGRVALALRDVPKGTGSSAGVDGSGRARGECLILCADRYHFAVSTVAAWQADLTVASPPNFESATLADLIASERVEIVLTDSERMGTSAKEHRVQELLAQARPAFHADELRRIDGTARVAVLYTSGTTGAQKRVEKTAAQLLGEAHDAARLFGIGPGEVVLSTTTGHHIYGMLFGTLIPLAGGATFVRETPFHAAAIAEAARRFHATTLVGVPAHLAGIAARGPQSLGTLKRIFSSAAPLRPSVRDELSERLQVEVLELLGSTETGGFAWRSSSERTTEWRALPGVRISANAEGLLELQSPYADGGIGERHVCADRVSMLDDGTFRHLGRQDGIVKLGGKRVALQHLEEETLAIAGVNDAAAIAVEVGGLRGAEIWLAVVAPAHDTVTIRQELGTRFDAVVLPRRIRCVEQLPRGENGKLARADLLRIFDGADSRRTF